jgi:dienelactone hydrolase
MKQLLLTTTIFLASMSLAQAALKTQTVEYKQGDTVLEGYLAYDDSFTGKRPGVLVVHEWKGLNDYAKKRADMLAQLGYVAFAADIYGKGVRPQTVEEAGAEAGKYKNNRPLFRQRVLAGLDQLKAQPNVDPQKLAAIGYCFGGTAVLELGRAGGDVKGIVTFHGGLSSPTPEDAKNIKAKVLVLHGADDPFVPPTEVAGFEKEMKDANVNYQLIKYPGAVHGFSNPDNKGELKGALYNKEADEKSWQEMQKFFKEIFA